MRILGIAGSVRRGSHNRRLLAAAGNTLPPEAELVEWDGLGGLPIFDEDLENDPPEIVQEFLDAITDADALLIATPEYNASLPGGLKNALDWASRPFPDNVLKAKPAAVIGASTGLFGAVWAQAEVRKVLKASGAHVLESELPVGMADGAFNDDGSLADPELTSRLGDLAGDLVQGGARAGRDIGMIGVVPDLPVFGGDAPKERADAARNRLRILEAASGLVDEKGIEHVSMEDVACKAGVGTGTLYRRFGDRTGLVLALLDEHTRDFQNALISGPPPLGPGAPASERLRAFGDGYLDLMETHADLLVAASTSDMDGRGPLSLYATHLGILLREAAPAPGPGVHRLVAAGHALARRVRHAAPRPGLADGAPALRLVRPGRRAQLVAGLKPTITSARWQALETRCASPAGTIASSPGPISRSSPPTVSRTRPSTTRIIVSCASRTRRVGTSDS